MKEADYEPEEGEIQDDDGQDDVQPSFPGLLARSTGNSDYANSHCVPFIRGDLHHRQTESLHAGESIRSLEMEWVSPCKNHPSRSPRFRVNGIPNRHFHNRPCVKDWNPVKPVCRSTLKESRPREAHATASKLWPSAFNKSLHPYSSTSNLSNSGNGFESVSNKWSHYSKSAKGDSTKRKWTCDKSTETREYQQKRGGRSTTKWDNPVSDKNKNIAIPEQPGASEKNDMKAKSKNESTQDNALSDSSDSIEIIEVPKKVPELITIDGSDDELDNGNGSSSKASDEDLKDNVTNTLINEQIPLNEENKSPSHSEPLLSSQEESKVDSNEIDTTKNTVEDCQEENVANSPSEKSNNTPTNQCETLPPDLISEVSTTENLPIVCGMEGHSITITSHSPSPEESPLQNSDYPVSKPAPSSTLIEGNELSAVAGSTDTQLQISDKNETSTVSNDALKDTSDSITATKNVENNTDENTIETIIAKGKSTIPEYFSYLENTVSESKDVFSDKQITAFSLGHVLSNRFNSDVSHVTQSQYATVYFDRVGANNSKCRNYEEQNYKFSVKVPEFIINLGKDSDSGDDSDSKYDPNNKANHKHNMKLEAKKDILTPAIPVDFEKKLDVLLKQARYQQEENTQKFGENYRGNNDTMSRSLHTTHQHNAHELRNNEISRNIAIPQSCARVLPSLKNIINSKGSKNKSRNGIIRNSYNNVCHERINGNGLYVKAARRLVSKSVDHNNQVTQGFNKRYQSHSKVINQTPSLQSGINIGLLSPHKQREYIKLKRKLVQLTRKTKEGRCTGTHEVVTSTILSVNENKPEEIKVNKTAVRTAAMRSHKHPVVQKSIVSCEFRKGASPENLSPKISSASPVSNCNISHVNIRREPSTTNANNTGNSNNCPLENISHQPITHQPIIDCTDITNEINVECDFIISEIKDTDCPTNSNELVKNDFPNSDSNNTDQDTVHMKESEVVANPHANIQEVSKEKSPQIKRKSSFDKNLSPVQKKQCTTNEQIEKNSDKPPVAVTMIPFTIITADGKLAEQLWSSETRLIAKRRQVLEDIATVRLNLHKMEVVNFKRNLVMEEIQKLKEQLKEADLHLSQKSEDLNTLDERVGDAKQNIQKCQSELLSLTLECEELGCKVHGPNYNVPNTCADLIRNEMTAMTEAIQLMEIQKKPEAALQ